MKNKKEKREKMREVISILKEEYPEAGIQLTAETPWQLLVAVVLSAQCTDKRVNMITKELFACCSEPEDFIALPVEELEQMIFSAGFYKAKSKNIKAAAEMLVDKYKGQMPSSMEELLTLPGVGRKSANVILGHCFDVPAIVVDTHVKRLSYRMGFTDTKDPEKAEFALLDIVEEKDMVRFNHLLIEHGRSVCSSRKPKCEKCIIAELCEKQGL